MTLDEAINHCLEVVEQNDTQAEKWQKEGGEQWGKTTACRECAADHRQLAEWLMEYKDLKAEQNDQYVFIHELMSELKEAKRLLKLAVTCLNDGGCTKDCDVCTNLEDCIRKRHDNSFKWRYTDEVKELIND